MLSKPLIHITTFIFVLAACEYETASTATAINFGDSLKVFKNPGHLYIPDFEKVAMAVPLDSLQNGFNDYQIRIWLGHSMAARKNTIILKKTGDKWEGELLTYKNAAFQRFDKTIKILDYRKIAPKSGWHEFFQSEEWIQINKFFSSPDTVCYTGSGGGDGINYIFEVASKDKFRVYNFGNPSEDSINNLHARNILKFTDLLEKEFSFKYTR